MSLAVESSAPAVPVAQPEVPSSLKELWPKLRRLPAAERLEAIALLAQSLQTAEEAASLKQLPGFVGTWADDPEADQIERVICSVRQADASKSMK